MFLGPFLSVGICTFYTSRLFLIIQSNISTQWSWQVTAKTTAILNNVYNQTNTLTTIPKVGANILRESLTVWQCLSTPECEEGIASASAPFTYCSCMCCYNYCFTPWTKHFNSGQHFLSFFVDVQKLCLLASFHQFDNRNSMVDNFRCFESIIYIS